jgi:hypothetical protein
MPGARCTRGLVCKVHKGMRTRAYRFSGGNPAFPAQWLYGLCRALPGDEFVLSPSSRGLMACRCPVEPDMPPRTWRQQRASGPHGFAVRDPSSPRGFAGPGTLPTKLWRRQKQRRSSCALLFAHGNRPANKPAAPDAAASTASHPAFVTIAIRPSSGMRWRELIALICPTGPAEYFCEGDWTTQISLKSQRNSKFTRRRFLGP